MTDYIDKGCTDGTILGQDTTSLVGFWGVTPVAQASALTAAATAITYTTASASLSTTIQITAGASSWGFVGTSEAQTFCKAVQNLQLRQAEIETALVNCGLVAGGTAVGDPTAVDFVGAGDDVGDILGQSTSKLVGFWGTAPVNQPDAFTAAVTVTAEPVIVVTVTASVIAAQSGNVGILIQESTTAKGFLTFNAGATFLRVVSNMESRLAEINTRLVEVGLIAGGTGKTSATKYDYLDKDNDAGTVMGRNTTSLLGFWGATGTAQVSALTTAALTIIASISTTSTDAAIAALISTTAAYKFGTTAAQTMLDAVRRLQIRMGEIESAMETVGFVADDGVS